MPIIVFIHVNWCRSKTCSVRFGSSDLDETSCIDLFGDCICEVCIFEVFNPPLLPKIFPLFLNNFPFSGMDETSYMDSFWDAISDVCIFFSSKVFSLELLNCFPLSNFDAFPIHFRMPFVMFVFFSEFLSLSSLNSALPPSIKIGM